MRLKAVRKKYPMYNDLSDDELAKKMHAKFYKNVDYKEFLKKFYADEPKKVVKMERKETPKEVQKEPKGEPDKIEQSVTSLAISSAYIANQIPEIKVVMSGIAGAIKDKPKKTWQFTVHRDDGNFIESITAEEI